MQIASDSKNRTTPSSAVDKPIFMQGRKGKSNEIFVDVYEKISVTFNSNVRREMVAAQCREESHGSCLGVSTELVHRRDDSNEELLVRQS